MIKLYTTPSCLSCRKVKHFFDTHGIKYEEKNILNYPLTREDLYGMLMNSENGFEDIISVRSKVFKENDLDLEEMTSNQLIDFIIDNPTILKRPIILTDYDLQVGYNDDDITTFLPKDLRKIIYNQDICKDCPQPCQYVDNLSLPKHLTESKQK